MQGVTSAMLALLLAVPWPARGQENTPPEASLHLAALAGNVDVVRQHVATGSDLDARDAYGSTPLIIATTFGRSEVARALIEAGADLAVSNNEGSTPLHLAALFGRTEIAGALLKNGADRYLRNTDGATPFDLVVPSFEEDRWLYDRLGAALAPLGLKLDYERIAAVRPRIRELMRPDAEELAAVAYAPVPGRVGRYFRAVGYGYQWWSARVDGRGFDFAWGHGGQLIVLLHELDMVVVSDPQVGRHGDEAWKHERAKLNLVGKFVRSLPGA